MKHILMKMKETELTYRAAMIAPYVHPDVASFFQFTINKSDVKITPLNIDRAVGLFHDSSDVKALGINFDKIVDDLKQLDDISYSNKVNGYIVNEDVLN